MSKVNIEKSIVIHCPREKDAKTFIKFLYECTDFTRGATPKDMPPKEKTYWKDYAENTCYHLDVRYYNISYGSKNLYIDDFPGLSIISFEDFAKKYMTPVDATYTINIKRKKNQTVATLFNSDGKYVKHAEARCHYKDKYDFEVGKKLAMERLFSNPTATPKSELYSKTYVINMLAELIDALEGWIEIDRNLSELFCGDLAESPLFAMKESFEMLVFDVLLEATGHKEEYEDLEDIEDFFFGATWNLAGCGEHICRQGGERFSICSAEELYEFFMNYEKMKEYFELED